MSSLEQNLSNCNTTNYKIATPYAGFEGMLLSMCGKLTIEKLKVSLICHKSRYKTYHSGLQW